jgi:hypothetical protein
VWRLGATFHVLGNVGECEGMNPHTPKWAFTLGIEVLMTLEFSRRNCKGKKSLDWRVNYIIRKFLEHKCLKWACMTHLDTLNISYGQKKGRESNCQIWLLTIKSRESLNLFVCKWRATYRWKTLNKDYNFAWDFISIAGLHTKLCSPKVVGISTLGILGLSGQNDIWVLVLWPSTKYI